jgi:putative membrane protein
MNTLCKTAFLLAGAATGVIAADSLSSTDHLFANTAAQGGVAEVELGKLAAAKGSNQKVKDFGKKMVDDHSKANDQLKSIAGKDNMTLPSSLSAKDQMLLHRLSNLSGAAFDKAYINAMVKDHETDIALFQHEASDGSNSDLKSFAAGALPTLQEHLSLAKDAAASVSR